VLTFKIKLSADAETKGEIEQLIDILRCRLMDYRPEITITGGAPCASEGLENDKGQSAIERERV